MIEIIDLDINAVERARREHLRGTKHIFSAQRGYDRDPLSALHLAHTVLSEAPRSEFVDEFNVSYSALVARLEPGEWRLASPGYAAQEAERAYAIMSSRTTLDELRALPEVS